MPRFQTERDALRFSFGGHTGISSHSREKLAFPHRARRENLAHRATAVRVTITERKGMILPRLQLLLLSPLRAIRRPETLACPSGLRGSRIPYPLVRTNRLSLGFPKGRSGLGCLSLPHLLPATQDYGQSVCGDSYRGRRWKVVGY